MAIREPVIIPMIYFNIKSMLLVHLFNFDCFSIYYYTKTKLKVNDT